MMQSEGGKARGRSRKALAFSDLGGSAPTVLVVDDEEAVLRAMQRLITRAGGRAVTLDNPLQAVSAVADEPVEVALIDLKMPHIDGLDLLALLKEAHPEVEVVMMTAHATIETAVAAMKMGAYDYLTKPFSETSDVVAVVLRAVERARLQKRNKELEQALDTSTSFEGMVGSARGMREVFEMIDSVAYSSSTVLVQGESGTGKELVARAMHRRSPRREGPFVPLNCTAVPETLLESELFGHVKGAFTGATAYKKGLFEAAEGGTLFLDEIGDLPAPVQAKLLRVLQEGEVRPVGSNQTRRIDVRIVAATNHDLEEAKADGRFREDLYYRLNVIPIRVPPLRERVEDIPTLSHHFLRRFATRDRKSLVGFEQEAMRALCAYEWPGNVRELENVVERASVLCRGESVEMRHLPGQLRNEVGSRAADGDALTGLPYAEAKEAAMVSFDKRYLESVLRRANGNISESARLSGMDRSNFRRILKRHGMDAARFASD